MRARARWNLGDLFWALCSGLHGGGLVRGRSDEQWRFVMPAVRGAVLCGGVARDEGGGCELGW